MSSAESCDLRVDFAIMWVRVFVKKKSVPPQDFYVTMKLNFC